MIVNLITVLFLSNVPRYLSQPVDPLPLIVHTLNQDRKARSPGSMRDKITQKMHIINRLV